MKMKQQSRITSIVQHGKKSKCPSGVYNNGRHVFCIDEFEPSKVVPLIKKATESSLSGNKSLPMGRKSFRNSLSKFSVNAIAATVEEGTHCFDPDVQWIPSSRKFKRYKKSKQYFWAEDLNPYNPASRFARHLRNVFNNSENAGDYLGKGDSILSVALSFDYGETAGRMNNTCLVGLSSVGEKVEVTWSDHEIGNPSSTLSTGDFSKIWVETCYIVLLAVCVGYGARWKDFLANYSANVQPLLTLHPRSIKATVCQLHRPGTLLIILLLATIYLLFSTRMLIAHAMSENINVA